MTAEQPAPRGQCPRIFPTRCILYEGHENEGSPHVGGAEAAAGQPPSDEAVLNGLWDEWILFNEDATKKGSGFTRDQMTGAAGFHSFLKERWLASPPPTAAPPEDWSEIQHPGYGEGAAPERVSGDKESHPVPPMEAGAAISPSTVSDQHSAPERVGSAPPAVSGLDLLKRLTDAGDDYLLRSSVDPTRSLGAAAVASRGRMKDALEAAHSFLQEEVGPAARTGDKDD